MRNWIINRLEISHGNNTTLLSMEGLRGIAVFLVFIVHYSSIIEPYTSGISSSMLQFPKTFGNLGVDLFFVLSGFLIYGTIVSKDRFSVINYALRRAQRIYPAFLAVFLVYIFLSYLFPSESKLPSNTTDLLIYAVQNLLFIPGLFDIEPIITVAWSLSYEVLYYLAIPVIIFSLKLKQWDPKIRIALWLSVAIFGFVFFANFDGPIRLLMFICGILIFELFNNLQFSPAKGGLASLLIAISAFGVMSLNGANHAFSLGLVFIAFLYFGLCTFNRKSNAYSLFTFTPLRWLGNMSYSYYLIHGLTLKFSFLVLGKVLPNGFTSDHMFFWLWVPLFVLTLLTSLCLFLLVEHPLSLSKKTTIKSNRQTLQTA